MPYRILWNQLVLALATWSIMAALSSPAQAAVDPYVARYLQVMEPIALALDGQGHTRQLTPEELSQGKRLFEQNCLNCHVGGTTLSNPTVSLSLADLSGATPPRDTIAGLVHYFRQPMTYDGSEEAIDCRQVPETWLFQAEVEHLAGFILRAAQTAPGWGTETF